MSTGKLSMIFFGTDDFALICLQRLMEDPQFLVEAVVTPPDRPAGRSQVLTPCPVKGYALSQGIEVLHSPSEALKFSVDFFVVASYGNVLKSEILSHPKVACVNVHPSLLPKYRGASPIQSALLHGDAVTGVCVMRLVEALDAGPVYALCEEAIKPQDDAQTLRKRLAEAGAELLAQSLPGIACGEIEPQVQDESKATFCRSIDRVDGIVVWNEMSAVQVDRMRRAYHPWPGVSTHFKGKRLKLLRGYAEKETRNASLKPGTVISHESGAAVVASEGIFIVEVVQLEGKGSVSIDAFVRGHPDFIGALLS